MPNGSSWSSVLPWNKTQADVNKVWKLISAKISNQVYLSVHVIKNNILKFWGKKYKYIEWQIQAAIEKICFTLQDLPAQWIFWT